MPSTNRGSWPMEPQHQDLMQPLPPYEPDPMMYPGSIPTVMYPGIRSYHPRLALPAPGMVPVHVADRPLAQTATSALFADHQTGRRATRTQCAYGFPQRQKSELRRELRANIRANGFRHRLRLQQVRGQIARSRVASYAADS
jgi:hypothetical protein